MQAENSPPPVWTIGHSNHPLEKFQALLQRHEIALLVDVRRFPGSRRHPQFSQAALQSALGGIHIDYRHLPALGGRRRERLPESPNRAWRVEAFNAYADHMQSDEFREAVGQLEQWAETRRTMIMCAEALPWQCHRRLIADYLVAHGHPVWDVFPSGEARPHRLNEMAHVSSGMVTYPLRTLFDDEAAETL